MPFNHWIFYQSPLWFYILNLPWDTGRIPLEMGFWDSKQGPVPDVLQWLSQAVTCINLEDSSATWLEYTICQQFWLYDCKVNQWSGAQGALQPSTLSLPNNPRLARKPQSTTRVQIRQPIPSNQPHIGFSALFLKIVSINRGLVDQNHCFYLPPNWQHNWTGSPILELWSNMVTCFWISKVYFGNIMIRLKMPLIADEACWKFLQTHSNTKTRNNL